MTKFVEYGSEEFNLIMKSVGVYAPGAVGFSNWAVAYNVKIDWFSEEKFLEFGSEQEKLAYLLKFC